MSALVSTYGFAADTQIEIFPEQKKQQVKFGADIKLTIKNVADGNTSKVMDRFIEMGMDMVRLPFFPIRDVTDPFYDKVFKVADIAEDKGLILFASVANGDGDANNWLHGAHKFSDKLICQSNCPKTFYNINLTAYAEYMDAFLDQMALHDAKVTFLGPFNEDRGAVSDYQQIWQQMHNNDFKRIGPELWGLGNSIIDTPKLLDLVDVVGSHFYDDSANKVDIHDSQWAALTEAANGKEVWFTEATRFEASNNDMTNLRTGLEHIFPSIRGGAERVIFYQAANRFVWYNGGTRAYRFSGVKQFTANAIGNVVDSTSDDSAVKTVSFYDAGVLKVNITNGHLTPQITMINLKGNYAALGNGSQVLWTSEVEAGLSEIAFDDSPCWTLTVPANSYLQLSVPVVAQSSSTVDDCQHIALPQDSDLPDYDKDGIADYIDEDDDNDNIADEFDEFPFDATRSGTQTEETEETEDAEDTVNEEVELPLPEQKSSGGSLSGVWALLMLLGVRRFIKLRIK